MTPEQIAAAERLVWLAGFVAIVVAIGAFDWRFGLLTAGVLLWISAFDVPRWRR